MKWKEPLMIAAAVFIIAAVVVGYKAMTSPPVPDEGADLSPAHFFITQSRHVSINSDKDEYATTLFVNYSQSKISEVNAEFMLFSEKPLRRAYLLTYPRVDSPGYDDFEKRLSERLALYGIHVSNITMDEAVYLRRSVIIVATGAVPNKLVEDKTAQFLLEGDNALILMGSPTRALRSDRSLSDIGSAFTDLVANNSRFIQKSSLREYGKTPEGAADEIYEMVLRNSWQTPISSRNATLRLNESEGQTALFSAPFPEQGSYYAAVLITAFPINGSYAPIGGILDTAQASRLGGSVFTQSDLFGNETLEFEYEIRESLGAPTHLSLYSEIAQGGRTLERAYLDDITLDKFWHSQSNVRLSLPPGDYELRITDQAGNPYGSAYLHVKSVEVRLLEVNDIYHRFGFYVDGKPYANERLTAWLDDSENRRDYMTDGSGQFTINANPSTGDHVFNFAVWGRNLAVPYTNTRVSVASRLMSYYGIAGAIIIVLVIATRRGITQSWSLIVDAPPQQKAKLAKIKKSQLFRAMKLYAEDRGWQATPLSVNDIFIAVKKYVTLDGKQIVASESNLLNILNTLVKRGAVLHHMDYYMPASWLDGGEYRRLCASRFLGDALLELGLDPEQEPGCDFAVKSPLGKSCILIYAGQKPSDLLKLSSKGRGVLLFMNEEELGLFGDALLSPEGEWPRIALNVWNKKLEPMMLQDFKEKFST